MNTKNHLSSLNLLSYNFIRYSLIAVFCSMNSLKSVCTNLDFCFSFEREVFQWNSGSTQKILIHRFRLNNFNKLIFFTNMTSNISKES